MTTKVSEQKCQVYRGRIFPERTIAPEEVARLSEQRKALGYKCRQIFEQVRPQLLATHYNWFIAIDPDNSSNYLLAPNFEELMEKVSSIYPDGEVKLTAFRLNESGACGKI
ncbi:MAG: hypothetical protein GDA38_24955 [Hormoscilla sp. SP12CHS1]|nr:hypothetical protein [Hormoscilla sp. SP12CHS1]